MMSRGGFNEKIQRCKLTSGANCYSCSNFYRENNYRLCSIFEHLEFRTVPYLDFLECHLLYPSCNCRSYHQHTYQKAQAMTKDPDLHPFGGDPGRCVLFFALFIDHFVQRC